MKLFPVHHSSCKLVYFLSFDLDRLKNKQKLHLLTQLQAKLNQKIFYSKVINILS